MKTLPACFLFILALAGLLTGQSQEVQPSMIEKSMKIKEPAWELTKKEAEPKSTIYRWKSGREKVTAEVFVTASPEAAAAKFQEFKRRMPVPPKKKLQGLGDEALLWQSLNTDGCMILFRKSNVFFHIDGSVLNDAQRLAGHLDNLVGQK